MPWINGRFYANPIFGRALERARVADSGQVWSEQYPELGFEPVANRDPSNATPKQATSPQREGQSQANHRSDADHWVTINGRRVLIHEPQGTPKSEGLPPSGKASICADRFEGKPTANGETFHQSAYSAALLPQSRWYALPLGMRVKLTSGNQSVVVKINDRGSGDKISESTRALDLSRAAASALTGQNVASDKDSRRIGLIPLDKIEAVPGNTPLGPVKH